MRSSISARPLRPRRRGLLPRAEERARASSTATSARWRRRRVGQGAARRADRVLAERLQRARAADGHRSLSDSGRSTDYPAKSIRQIPGAFERLPHRVAGRTLTLDQIEQTVLPEFHDPRVYFALGRGAVGSGRLRSEAFTAAQLEDAAGRGRARVRHPGAVRPASIARPTRSRVSSIFSWREKEFAADVRRQGAARLRIPQPDRARGARLRPAEAADDRAGVPGEEHLPAGLHRRSTGPSTT